MKIPIEQQNIRDRCLHPSGTFVEFRKEEVEQSIPARFEQIVRLFPDNLALATQNQELTYAQLNLLANRVAWLILQEYPVPDGRPLALLFEKEVSLLAAVVGAMKTGHAYTVLDPSDTPSRIRQVLAQLEPELIVTNRRNLPLARELQKGEGRIVDVDNVGVEVPDGNPNRVIPPTTVAQIVYTSGSTGQPKGVMIPHRTELQRTMVVSNCLHLCPSDRVALLAALTSAHSLMAIWRALLIGASVHHFDARKSELHGLAQWLVDRRITFLHIGVPAFRHFGQTLKGYESFPSVRILRLSSDQARSQDLEVYRKHFGPECVLIHGFASTETGSPTFYFVDKAHSIAEGPVSLGFPLEGNEILLLDENHKEVGAGEVGTIAIRSRYGPPGYWRDPELTRAKFITDASGDEVLFLTGDHGRETDQGIIYIGRTDARLRIRGYSVDATEIESALEGHDAVMEAVVSGVKDLSGEVQLVAYVVPRDSSVITEGLRSFLEEKLPDYMLPASFVMMDVLPLLPSGKFDRAALPTPDWTARHIDTPFVPPRNDLEAQLAGIWSDLLDVTQIGVHDNFFELGGHSLTGARIISRVFDVFQVELSVREFFEKPTIAATVECITGAREGAQDVTSPAIVPSARDGHLPLSFAQERLWFLDQLEPNTPFWNLPSSLRLTGELDVAVLEASLREIIRRHESLRTNFSVVDGEPVQIIHADRSLSVQRVDLHELEREVRDREVVRLVYEEAHHPFNLGQGPLFRVQLMELTASENVLFYNIHHIIFDGWSSGNMMRELGILMKAIGAGKPPPLEPLTVQYADYAVWEREWLQGDVLEQHLAYWREHLTGAPPFLELPTDRPRPRAETFRGERCRSTLSIELSERLQELSRREGTTVFMTLLATFNLLLYRLTGQGDLVVGMVSANRIRAEVERLIGFFLNVLPLRTRVKGEIPFRDLLGVIHRNCLEVYEHQGVPFKKIVEDQHPIRDLSYASMFQVVFSYAPVFQVGMFDMANPSERIDLPGLSVEWLPRRLSVSKYDLVLHASQGGEGIALAMDYNTDLFDEARVVGMLRQLEDLLEQVVADPERGVEAYSLVDTRSRALLPDPTAWLDESFVGAMHGLFSEQAARAPEQIAVSDSEDEWTYGELERRSNQLAHNLAAQGVGTGDIVAILGHRSSSLVWALLGVLKAGAAFTILDPSHPVARLKEYVRVAKPRGWVELEAGGERAELAATTEGIGCLIRLPRLGAVGESFDEYPSTDPGLEVGADDLAYVAFTSGSTGEPKGVLGRHGPMTHFMPAQQATYGFSATDRFILLSGLAYNLLHRDVFTPLALGAALYIPETLNSPEEVLESIARNEVTVLHLTPALGQMLAETAGERQLPSVRCSFLAGDTLTGQGVERLRKMLPNAQVINRYGATETQRATSECIVGNFGGAIPSLAKKQSVPLGRGIADVQMLVLNELQGLAGVGELGELFVRSPHLAAGYLDDAELTMERFVGNPFTADEQDRMYRTGEWARYLPDGKVQFVSRGKGSANIRGYRIELTEVEGILQQHEAVRQAVVVAKNFGEEGSGDERLVAYVSLRESGGRVDVRELRSYVRERLPEHMVPGYVEFLEAIPLTSNGKVNQGALPEPDRTRPELESSYVGPRTETEEILTGIWVELLHLERVGIHDNFFELGGHSLLATQVVQRMRDALKVEVTLRSLFESPTVTGLAELIDAIRWAGRTPDDASGQGIDEETF